MGKILVSLLLATLLVCTLVSAEKGVGLYWGQTEAKGYVGDKICVSYGLYNPFNTEVTTYLSVTGSLSSILDENLVKLIQSKKEIELNLTKVTSDYNLNRTIELAEQIDSLTKQKVKAEADLNKLYLDRSITINSGTSHENRTNQELCFYPKEKGIYEGEVIASFLSEGNSGTGSSTQVGASAPLTVIALDKEKSTPILYGIIGLVFLLLVSIGIYFLVKKKSKKTKTYLFLFLFLFCIGVVSADFSTPSSASVISPSNITIPSVVNLTSSPISGGYYSASQVYFFNATITSNSTIDTVFLNVSGTIYLAGNISNNYYVNITGLNVGSYTIYWYANDSSGGLNNTEHFSYSILETPGGGGGGGGSSNLLPNRLSVAYPLSVNKSSIFEISLGVYDYSNKPYKSSNVNLTFDNNHFELVSINFDNSSKLYGIKMKATNLGGNNLIRINVSDQRTLSQNISISIVEGKQGLLDKIFPFSIGNYTLNTSDITDWIKQNPIIFWSIIVFILIIIILIIFAVTRLRN